MISMKRLFAGTLASAALLAFAACDGGGSAGGKTDLSKFPNWKDPDAAVYAFGDAETVTPYWQGNVIYNETVMLVDEGDGVARAALQYKPVRILSVRDYKYDTEFAQGTDYTVKGNLITRTEGSAMPYLTRENLRGNNVPEPYRKVASPSEMSNTERDFTMMGSAIYTEGTLIYGHQVAVSYVCDVKDLDRGLYPEYSTSGTPRLKQKLADGENVKIVITGDSVAEGCSSSSHFNRPPYMPNFMQLAVAELGRAYPSAHIELDNRAKGGMTSDWGAAEAQVKGIIASAPDVVYIHFGINDLGQGSGPSVYIDNINALILGVQEALPDCEFVIIKAFTPNPAVYDSIQLEKYWARVDKSCQTLSNTYCLDMYSMSAAMLEVKDYMDVTGNGINHLNDFTSRLYAMSIVASLVK